MCFHHVSKLFVVFFGFTLENLLEDGDYMLVEIWLTCECVNNSGYVDFSCCIESWKLIVTFRWIRWQQEFYVLIWNQFCQNLNTLVNFSDGLVDINRLCIKHLVTHICIQRWVMTQDNDFVCIMNISSKKCILLQWTTIYQEDI